MRLKKGFTIIELLMVIAVIGLLSSIVLIFLNNARDKAELAKRKTFSQSIKSSLGAYKKQECNFDSGVLDPNVCDNGWVSPASIMNFALDDNGLEKKGVKPQTSGFYSLIIYGMDASKLSRSGLSFEAWMYPTLIVDPVNSFSFFSYSGTQLDYAGGSLSFFINQGGGNTCRIKVDKSFSGLFDLNKWNHIVATYSNKGIAKIYINGNLLVPTTSSCSPGDVYYEVGPTLVMMPTLEFFYGNISTVNAIFDQFRFYDETFIKD